MKPAPKAKAKAKGKAKMMAAGTCTETCTESKRQPETLVPLAEPVLLDRAPAKRGRTLPPPPADIMHLCRALGCARCRKAAVGCKKCRIKTKVAYTKEGDGLHFEK